MVSLTDLKVGDRVQVGGTDNEPRFFHVPGNKQGFIAKGLVGVVEKLYLPGTSDNLDRSDDRNVQLMFEEPKKWKAHFAPSELVSIDSDQPSTADMPYTFSAEVGVCLVKANSSCDRVDQFMTPISDALVLAPQMLMLEAAALLNRHSRTGAPVAKDGRLVGVLTQFDFLYLEGLRSDSGGAARSVALDSGNWERTIKKSLASTVSVAMSKPVAVTDEADMEQCAQLMLKRRFNHVPVVDASGDLVGILTSQDVLRHVLLKLGGEDALVTGGAVSGGPRRRGLRGLLGRWKQRVSRRQ